MAYYHMQQCAQVCPFPPESKFAGQLKLKIMADSGLDNPKRQTNWMNITPEAFKKIEEILLEME